jgi:GNS1/SUR4 family
MFVGVATTIIGFYYLRTDPTCAIGAENTNAGFLLYGSYLVLFLQFFAARYFTTPSKTIGKKKN